MTLRVCLPTPQRNPIFLICTYYTPRTENCQMTVCSCFFSPVLLYCFYTKNVPPAPGRRVEDSMDILLYAASAMTVFLCVAQLVLFPHRRHHHSHDSRGTKTHTHRSHARRRMLALAAAVINMILVVLGVAAAVLAAIFAKREAMAAGGDLELWI